MFPDGTRVSPVCCPLLPDRQRSSGPVSTLRRLMIPNPLELPNTLRPVSGAPLLSPLSRHRIPGLLLGRRGLGQRSVGIATLLRSLARMQTMAAVSPISRLGALSNGATVPTMTSVNEDNAGMKTFCQSAVAFSRVPGMGKKLVAPYLSFLVPPSCGGCGAGVNAQNFLRNDITRALPCGCRNHNAALSLSLPQQCRKGRGLYSCGAATLGRRFSKLETKAGIELDEEAEETEMQGDSSGFLEKAFLAAAIVLMPLVDVEAASAAGGEFGLLEGRSFALLHPIVMGGLFAFTIYAGYLGWQWRRVRTIQNEINELKKQVPKVTVAVGESSAPPPPPSPIEAQISSLTEERKELIKGGFRDKHFNAGSILLGLGVFVSVVGPVNTWFRTGKLFPGPHLFAGAAIVVLWAVAASLVPAMQRGNETARTLHIGLNLVNVALFVWQIPTGWDIVLKVFQFTTWP